MNSKFGLQTDRLRILREQRGWSQRELAKRCGFSDALIRRYEIGENDPTGGALKLIAKQLEVSVDYLLGVSDDPRIQVREPSLDDSERTILEIYRRDGWQGVARLSVERLSK